MDFYREQRELIFKTIIDANVNINMSMFYEKKDTYKILKDLTYNIGNVSVDLENSNKNRQDIDLVEFTYDDAKYIRRQLQIENEDFYFLYVYITTYAENLKELKNNIEKIEGILQSKGIKTKKAYFRQEQAFISTLPLMINHKDVKEATRRNILTNGLVATYPFISSSIFDKKGILIGKNIYNNSLIFIDRYNENKYKNANMCVFGTSGAGKSYYIKLNILRYRLLYFIFLLFYTEYTIIPMIIIIIPITCTTFKTVPAIAATLGESIASLPGAYVLVSIILSDFVVLPPVPVSVYPPEGAPPLGFAYTILLNTVDNIIKTIRISTILFISLIFFTIIFSFFYFNKVPHICMICLIFIE